jgi:hypothetical protein
MTTAKKTSAKQPAKRPYRTPKLTVHGNLRTLTLGKGGSLGDGGGKPKTRLTSGPG